MGKIVGAALVSHHPGLMQCEEFRVLMGHGQDSDLIAGYANIRAELDKLQADVLMIFDTHWFTTGYHLIDGGSEYSGHYISDEMPWYLNGVPYHYQGEPELAGLVEDVAREQKVRSRAIYQPTLPRHYGSINIIKKLARKEKIVSVSSCQNCRPEHFLQSGKVIAEAIARSNLRVVLLASGALSHRFTDIDWTPKHPRIFHEDNISRPEHVHLDKEAISYMEQGRHDLILQHWEQKFRPTYWEANGAHYLQMLGALGGEQCRAKGQTMSAYENARGTGNVHIWFDLETN